LLRKTRCPREGQSDQPAAKCCEPVSLMTYLLWVPIAAQGAHGLERFFGIQ